MLHVKEADIEGERPRDTTGVVVKHLVAPWTVGSEAMSVGFSVLEEAATTELSAQSGEEVLIVLSGTGVVVVDDEAADVAPGSVIRVPSGARRQLRNEGSGVLRVACVASPAVLRSGDRVAG